MSLASAFAAVAYYISPVSRPAPHAPKALPAAAVWLSSHPADWITASLITEQALDVVPATRFELWHEAHAAAVALAPWRTNPRIAFVRSGFFHWYELPDGDRRAVLTEAKPLLRDRNIFTEIYLPLFQLTGDMKTFREANPGTMEALQNLKDLSVNHGFFGDYRSFRKQAVQKRLQSFLESKATRTSPDLATVLPEHPSREDEPLIRAVLEEWHRRPLDGPPGQPLDGLLDYALRHGLLPLDGLEYLVGHPVAPDPLRARLALRLGLPDRAAEIESGSNVIDPPLWRQYHLERARVEAARSDAKAASSDLARAAAAGVHPETLSAAAGIDGDERSTAELEARFRGPVTWEGLCGTDVCTSAHGWIFVPAAAPLTLRLETVQTDEYPPYVEVFADDLRAAEGPVGPVTTMQLAALQPGLHRLELRLVNSRTRNGLQRRIRPVG